MARTLLRRLHGHFSFFPFKLQKQAYTPHSVVTKMLHYLLNFLKLVVILLGPVEKSCQFIQKENPAHLPGTF